MFINNLNGERFIEYVEANQNYRLKIEDIETLIQFIKDYKYRILGFAKAAAVVEMKVYQIGETPKQATTNANQTSVSSLVLGNANQAYMAVLANLPSEVARLWYEEFSLFYEMHKSKKTPLDLLIELRRTDCFLAVLENINENQLRHLLQTIIDKKAVYLFELLYAKETIAAKIKNIQFNNASILDYALKKKSYPIIEWLVNHDICTQEINSAGEPIFMLLYDVYSKHQWAFEDDFVRKVKRVLDVVPKCFLNDIIIRMLKNHDADMLMYLARARKGDIDISLPATNGKTPLEYSLSQRRVIFRGDEENVDEEGFQRGSRGDEQFKLLIAFSGFDYKLVIKTFFKAKAMDRLAVLLEESPGAAQQIVDVCKQEGPKFCSTLFYERRWDICLKMYKKIGVRFLDISPFVPHYLGICGDDSEEYETLCRNLFKHISTQQLTKPTSTNKTPQSLAKKRGNIYFFQHVESYHRRALSVVNNNTLHLRRQRCGS